MSKRPLILLLVVLGLATAGTAIGAAGGPPFGPHCSSPEEARTHVSRVVDHILDSVDATDEQATRIDAIVDGAIEELDPIHQGMEAHHQQARAVLTAETVDPLAIEALRVDAVSRFDQASRIIASAIGDIGAELTVEQRLTLADKTDRFHGR